MQERKHRDAYEILNVRRDAHEAVIKAAYRALAALYHPDRDPSPGAARRMVELNRAYADLRTGDGRTAYDSRGPAPSTPPTPQAAVPPPEPATNRFRPPPPNGRPTTGSTLVDFGRYQGWTIADLARQDPDYLRWLSRHSSGIRYRREIAERLTAAAAAATTETPPSKRRR